MKDKIYLETTNTPKQYWMNIDNKAKIKISKNLYTDLQDYLNKTKRIWNYIDLREIIIGKRNYYFSINQEIGLDKSFWIKITKPQYYKLIKQLSISESDEENKKYRRNRKNEKSFSKP